MGTGQQMALRSLTPGRSGCRRSAGGLFLERRRIALVDLGPVDDVPPGLEVLGAAVLILEVVGVLPDVVAHDRRHALRDRAVLIGGGEHLQAAGSEGEPGPAAAELLD